MLEVIRNFRHFSVTMNFDLSVYPRKQKISPDPKPLSALIFKLKRAIEKLFGEDHAYSRRVFPSTQTILPSPSFYFPLFLTLFLSISAPAVFLPASFPLCHSAHLGCLVELGTSVPVRGAQWGPVEDTKGGLLQLSFTLRPTQQPFGVYSSVLNPHTQPYHKGTSLAWAQRSPLLTPS